LQEETNEFLEAENTEEFADILEVLDAISDYKNFNEEEIKILKTKKQKNEGSLKIK